MVPFRVPQGLAHPPDDVEPAARGVLGGDERAHHGGEPARRVVEVVLEPCRRHPADVGESCVERVHGGRRHRGRGRQGQRDPASGNGGGGRAHVRRRLVEHIHRPLEVVGEGVVPGRAAGRIRAVAHVTARSGQRGRGGTGGLDAGGERADGDDGLVELGPVALGEDRDPVHLLGEAHAHGRGLQVVERLVEAGDACAEVGVHGATLGGAAVPSGPAGPRLWTRARTWNNGDVTDWNKLADITPAIALGPLDGRYRGAVAPLVDHLSEAALNRARLHVEVEWFIHLADGAVVPGTRPLTPDERELLRAIPAAFGADEIAEHAAIERETVHDVKAIEYLIKRRIAGRRWSP